MDIIKKRGKKKVEFNLADYDYMDEMPLRGWMWEFKRRSVEYMIFWQEKGRLPGNQVLPGYGPQNPTEKFSEIDNIGVNTDFFRHLDGVSKSTPVESANLKWHSQKKRDIYTGKLLEKIPDSVAGSIVYPATKKDLLPYAKVIVADHERHSTFSYSRQDEGQDMFHPLSRLNKHLGKENVVMLLVDISAPKKMYHILLSIQSELKFWRDFLKYPKVRDAKSSKKESLVNKITQNARIWKSYLIIYDLNTTWQIDPRDISKMLSEYDTKYKSVVNVKTHLKKAKALINGGYKKYI